MKNVIDLTKTEIVLRRYVKLSEEIKALEAQKEELRTVILGEMVETGVPKVMAGGLCAVAVEQSRENFDLKTAKAELGVALLKPYLSKSNYFRLTVK
jgi:hypothetical protein